MTPFPLERTTKRITGLLGFVLVADFHWIVELVLFSAVKNHLLVLYKLDLLYLNTSLLRVSMHLFLPILDVCSVSVKIL